MSRHNRFRRPRNPGEAEPQTPQAQPEPCKQEEPPAQSGGAVEQRMDASIIRLHLGGRNPLRSFNAYLIPGAKHVLVDPGPPNMAGELLEQLSRHRVSLGDIGLIVITHGHPDHFGSACRLKEWTRAPLAVHELDAEYVNFGSTPVLTPVTRLGALFKSGFSIKAEPVEPDIILHDGDRLNRYGGRGRIIATPGHTAGSISILLPDGMCIVGDLLMRSWSGRSPSTPWFAENLAEARESLQKVVAAGAKTLLAGHCGPYDVEEVGRCFSWLEVPEGEPGGEQEPANSETPSEGGEHRRRRRPRHRRPQNRDEGNSGQPVSTEH